MTQYTIVRHSGYEFGGNRQFLTGLEVAPVNTKKERESVQKAGGKLFDSYDAAEEYAYQEMYPPHIKGLIPMALGDFARAKINGLPIYVPQRQEEIVDGNA